MSIDLDAGDGLLGLLDLEIELARVVWRLARRVNDEACEVDGEPRVLSWFERAALDLVQRAAPEHRVFLTDRLHEVARSLSGRDVATVYAQGDSDVVRTAPVPAEPRFLVHVSERQSEYPRACF